MRSSERAAVKLAKKIQPLFRGVVSLRSDNCDEIAGRLAEITGLSAIRIRTMFLNLMPLKADNAGLLRLAFAIMSYLPLFNEEEGGWYEGVYRGVPPVWAHCRILSSCAIYGASRNYVQLIILPMSSIIAGRLLTVRMPIPKALGLVRHCGVHQRSDSAAPLPQELTSTYHYLRIGQSEGSLAIASAAWCKSEKEANKQLATLRHQRLCQQPEHIQCVDCCAGRDKCPAACRATTRRRESEVGGNSEPVHAEAAGSGEPGIADTSNDGLQPQG